MQVYAMKFHNFLRFGEENNTIVFDLTNKQKQDLADGTCTMDQIYEEVAKDPIRHISLAKKRGLEQQIGIIGLVAGDPDSSNGVGKCFAAGTKVLMYDGSSKSVEDIIVGDLVMGPDSKPRTVVSCHSGEGDLYAVLQNKKQTYVVNDAHELVLENKDKKRNSYKNSRYHVDGYRYKIAAKDFVHQSKTFRSYMGGVQSEAIEYPSHEVRIDPYLLGVWLGSGNSDSPSFTTEDTEIVKLLKSESKSRGLTLKKTSNLHYAISSRDANVILAHKIRAFDLQEQGLTYDKIAQELAKKMPQYSNGKRPCEASIWRWINDVKKCSGKIVYNQKGGNLKSKNSLLDDLNYYGLVQNKHIPAQYLVNDTEKRLQLLAGLIDSDGSVVGEKRTIHEITIKNELLAKNIASLARSLGFMVNIRGVIKECCNNSKVGRYWLISIIGRNTKIPVILERKRANSSKINKNYLVNKIHVSYAGRGKYFGFETDGDHLFLLDDYTIVHNSSIMEGICYAHYEKIVRKTANNDKIEKAGLSVVTKLDGEYPKGLRESYVEEFFEDNGSIYRIKRGRTFTKTKKSSSPILEFECINKDETDKRGSHRKTDTEDAVSDVLTMDYDVFVNSQMFGQSDAGKYLTGTDKIKKEMLISLLRLENVVTGCLELLRNRKNSQSKKVDGIKSNIEFLEEMFCKAYAKYSEYKDKKFDDNMPQNIVDLLLDARQKGTEKIKKCDIKTAEVQKKIDELTKSEKLARVEQIKEEGNRVKKEKATKEKDKAERINEWNKLKEESNGKVESIKLDIRSKESRLKVAQTQIETINKQLSDFDQIECNKKLAKISKVKSSKPETEKKLLKITTLRENLVKAIAGKEAKEKDVQTETATLQDQIENIKDGDDFICDKCKSKVSKEHVLNEIKKNQNEELQLKKEIKKFTKEREVAEKDITTLNEKIAKIERYILAETKILGEMETNKAVRANLGTVQNTVKELKDEIEEFKKRLADAQDKAKEYEEKVIQISATFDVEIKRIESHIENLREEFLEAKKNSQEVESCLKSQKELLDKISNIKNQTSKKLGFLDREISHYKNLHMQLMEKRTEYKDEIKLFNRYLLLESIYGLDGIQTRIVKKYLPLLNVYIKEFLDILSRGTILVSMVVNDKSKIDMVISGASADTYEMLSGGEKMLVRLAVDIGLALLSFARSSQKPEIICLDEIFGQLDNNNTESVFEMLKKLQNKFSRVIIITHNPDIQERLQSSIVIEKEAGTFGLSAIRRIE
jgi:DNA repair exonuclease SbcCD ATPase subunit